MMDGSIKIGDPPVVNARKRPPGRAASSVEQQLLAGQAALLPGAVRVAGPSRVCGVGPLTLDLPFGAVGERHQRRAKGPCALVAVLFAGRVVPGARIGGIG